MVDYVEIDSTESKTKDVGFHKGLYLIWFFGFISSFALTRIYFNYLVGDYMDSILWLLLCLIFLPPLNDNHFKTILESYKGLLK